MRFVGTAVDQYPQITYSALRAEVLRLADENPDYIYDNEDGCWYTPGPQYGLDGRKISPVEVCIFGRALANLGVAKSDLAAFEHGHVVQLIRGLGLTNDVDPQEMRQEDDPAYTNTTLELAFFATQRYQDEGATWSQAVEPLRIDPKFPSLDQARAT